MASNFKISTFISLSWIIICKSELIYGNEFLSLFIEEGNVGKNLNYDRTQLSVSPSNNFNEESNLKKENFLAEPLLENNKESLKKDEFQHPLNNERSVQQNAHFFQQSNFNTKEKEKPDLDYYQSSISQVTEMIAYGSKVILPQGITSKNNHSQNNMIASDIGTSNGNPQLNLTTDDSFEMSIPLNMSSNIDKFFNLSVGGNKSADELIHSLLENGFSGFGSNSSDSINELSKKRFLIDETEITIPKSNTSITSSTDSDNSKSINLGRRMTPRSFMQTNVTASQNRQNKLLPIALQTVIYHNRGSDYNKENNVQSESVSYNSFAQNVDSLNSWKELDSLIQVKQTVNDSLYNQNFRDAIKAYNQQTIYSEPAKTYSQPAKIYGEPSKIYSEPSKVYSEPAKIYSKPARVYSEPSKVYWPNSVPPTVGTTKYPITHRVIFNLDKLPYDLLNAPKPDEKLLDTDVVHNHYLTKTRNFNQNINVDLHNEQSNFDNQEQKYRPTTNFKIPTELNYRQNILNFRNLVTRKPNNSPVITENSDNIYATQKSTEQNYDDIATNEQISPIDQKSLAVTNTSLLMNSSSMLNKTDDSKIGYVVEGRNYRKYRVEEKTSEGFIVGEYGVVSHTDGSLRGVRYTADSAINSSLIYDALVKFLSL